MAHSLGRLQLYGYSLSFRFLAGVGYIIYVKNLTKEREREEIAKMYCSSYKKNTLLIIEFGTKFWTS